jgi:hypothetical protein
VKTCYFYTRIWDEAVAALPADAEFVYVGGAFTDYWDGIAARWGAGDLLIVEHDIRIHDQVIAQFDACPNMWCTFPYLHSPGYYLDCGIGCVRFRRQCQQAVTPQEIQHIWGSCWECAPDNTPGCWRHIDGKIKQALEDRGLQHHVHEPAVEHLKFRSSP